jgi:hypothetical protein
MSYTPTKPQNVTGTLQTNIGAPADGTSLTVTGYASAILTVSGSAAGLIIAVEGTEDGSNWSPLSVAQLGSTTISSTIVANGIYHVAVAGLRTIRAKVTAITSGNANVSAQAVMSTFTPQTLNAHLADKLDYVNDSITTYQTPHYITTISTATTTTVANFPVVVSEIRVLGGTLGNVTVYDSSSASGTIVVPALTPDKGQILVGCAANFSLGCTIVTAAATVITITWRPQ